MNDSKSLPEVLSLPPVDLKVQEDTLRVLAAIKETKETMKCRKLKKCNGTGVKTSDEYQGSPVYQCNKCGRRWAVSPKKKRWLKSV